MIELLFGNRFNKKTLAQTYDAQATRYANFSDGRFAWKYLESPAFDKYIPDLYRPNTRVLDIGCGTGVVARHLISRGISPENIIGIDISARQLEQARAQTPGVTFFQSSADEFDLPKGSVDLVTTNTVFQHLDNNVLRRMLDKIFDVLGENGTYFFTEIDPDHTAEGRDPRNTNRWTPIKTPWGTEVPFFNRDPYDLINLLDLHGFDMVSGWVIKVAQEGRDDNLREYLRYSSRPSRMAARYKKVTEEIRDKRKNPNLRIPNLTDPD